MKTLLYTAALLVIFTFTSCANLKITSSWHSQDSTNYRYKKILIIALATDDDRSLREKMENHMAGDLQEAGITAVSSIRQYGPKSFDSLKENEAINKVQNDGFDGIITITLLNKTLEKYYEPRSVYYSPYFIYSNWWWGYYSTMNQRIFSPGYYDISTNYFWESNLYNAATGKLQYSAQTRSFNPSSTEVLAHQYGKMIMHNMIDKKVLLK